MQELGVRNRGGRGQEGSPVGTSFPCCGSFLPFRYESEKLLGDLPWEIALLYGQEVRNMERGPQEQLQMLPPPGDQTD